MTRENIWTDVELRIFDLLEERKYDELKRLFIEIIGKGDSQ
jgi:hypothetical protein